MNTSISASYWPLLLSGTAASDVFVPTAITVSSGGSVYATGYDSTTNLGYVFGFTTGSDGTLTAIPGFPVAVGTHPSAIASDASGAYLYVTDSAQNVVHGFQINGGALTALSGSPFATGGQPGAIVLDATGKYAMVANAQDSNLSVYSVSAGNLSRLGTYTTGTQPVAIGIDPSLNQYVYTANFLGNNVSGFQLNPDRWFTPEFAVFTFSSQSQSNGGRSHYAWQYQEIALQPSAKAAGFERQKKHAALDSSIPFRAFTMTERYLNQHSLGLTLTARDEGSA